MASSRVRLVDLARLAGVTTTTASLALNNKAGVSEETRERIAKLARDLGYVPHQGARALAKGRSGLWAAWVSGPEEVWARWLSGLFAQTSSRVVVSRLPSRDRRPEALRGAIAEGRVDGCLVFDPEGDDAGLQPLWESGIPTVVAGRRSHWFDCVEIHDRQALESLLGRLSLGGRRAVSLVATRHQVHRDDDRLRAWRTAQSELEGASLATVTEDSPEQGIQVASLFLSQPRRPEAILCLAGDKTALGIVREARLRKISVPGELAIAGWGDLPLSGWTEPELTTVSIPWEEVGVRSALALSRRGSRKDLPRTHKSLDARAILRRSG
ncbi:MAG: LacI family DNA-binding transcriptional regulator [Fibrobacteria bacterium]|nr:LacI family DNA-binding transcriptional regulator [Fibrobacteria bacterium]